MPDIRKILSKCQIKRCGYIHENLVTVNNGGKGYGQLVINVDPQTASSMMRYAIAGRLEEAVLMIVVDPEEFNKAFNEVKGAEKLEKKESTS